MTPNKISRLFIATLLAAFLPLVNAADKPAGKSAAIEAPAEQASPEPVGRDDPRIRLLEAVLWNDGKAVKRLLGEGVDPNIRELAKGPAIVMAALEGSNDAVKELLAAPALKVDAVNDANETALMMAAMIGNKEAVTQLLAHGADVNGKAWSPLHYAASNGHGDIVKALIDAGADIDALSPNNSTPLMMATRRGNFTPYQVLLLAGADPRPVNDSGLTAADYLDRIGESRRAGVLRSYARGFVPGEIRTKKN